LSRVSSASLSLRVIAAAYPRRRALAVAIGVLIALACASAARAATVTVTTAADDITPNDGSVSLREAITSINAGSNLGDPDISSQSPGTYGSNDAIHFDILPAGVKTIDVGSDPSASGIGLPQITKPVTLDATTQPGAGRIRVALNGTSAGGTALGIEVGARSTVKGFDVEHFGGYGIQLDEVFSGPPFFFTVASSTASDVDSNFVGTDPTGAAAGANGGGINVLTDRNTIQRNVVSANGAQGGIVLIGDRNDVGRNFVGTNADGGAALGNAATGFGGAVAVNGDLNTIGGSSIFDRNVISGNNGAGVKVTGSNVVVQGNFIGTDATGLHPIPNSGDGVRLEDPTDTVSGTPGAPQRIWFNGGRGIHEAGTGEVFSANSIRKNQLGGIATGGTPATGKLKLAPDRKTLTVSFSKGTPGGLMTVEAFDNPKAPACPGQGQTFVGGATAAISSSGKGTVTMLLGTTLTPGDGLTATLTDSSKGTSPFVCLAGGVPHPSNKFKFSVKSDKQGTLTLTIHSPGPGSFKAKATTKFGGKKVSYGKGSRAATGPGTLTLKIHPRKDVKADLAGGASLKVSVAVTFKPDGGTARTKRKSITVG
jgi:CSLREA domain-containing protein